ncbi:MAG: hypothetical protein D6724_05920 [Armatimonadetes bacterium]|nr:MAG: hypothetical protein D6724_05920 [Armatimonadota bacterium]
MFLTTLAAVALAPQSVELTIYNANFALVKEVRQVSLQNGRQELRIEDVAGSIDPTSVSIKGLEGSPFEVLEQNYQYDLLSPESILAKSIGKRVRLHQLLESGQRVTTEGVLLAAPGRVVASGDGSRQVYSGLVLQTDDGRFILNPEGTIEVLELPEGLISKPTLMWDLFAQGAGQRKIEVAYLANNITWSADYVLTLSADDTRADLNGWVTINNQSGATYANATLKLIAGDVRRVQPRQDVRFRGGAVEMQAGAPRGFEEESLFEYHLYTLGRPATVRNRETKQISLLSAQNVAVKKRLVIEGQRSVWYGAGRNYRPAEGYATDPNLKANVLVDVVNSEKAGLGMPLPKGKVRVYKRDASGQVQMVGEDLIDHTPREEKFSLYVGDAFDIAAERRRVSFRRIANNVVEETFEIKVRNRKKVAETVEIIEHGWGDWEILNETQKSEKVDSNTFKYTLTLQPDQEGVVRYTIRTTW